MKKTLSLLLLSFLGLAAPAQRIEVSTGLPGLLGSLSTGNGGGVLTNLAFPHITWYTNQNTTNIYTPPIGARLVITEMISQGGGGGSGRRGAAGTLRTGGGGGAGGAYAWRQFTDLSSITSLVIVIPPISTGGPAVTTDDSNGTNGLSGVVTAIYANSISTTNVLLRAGGTSARGSGGNSTGAGAGGSSIVGTFPGGLGGASSGTGAVGAAGALSTTGGGIGGGGGAGGGITTGDVPAAGGNGGVPYVNMFETPQAAGGNPGLPGASLGTASPLITIGQFAGWPGAGGGGAQTNAAAGDGANGYGWGSGGGGGGASLNGYLSGKGGDGGPSIVRITAY